MDKETTGAATMEKTHQPTEPVKAQATTAQRAKVPHKKMIRGTRKVRRHFQRKGAAILSPLEVLFGIVSKAKKGPGGTVTLPGYVYAQAQEALRAAVA